MNKEKAMRKLKIRNDEYVVTKIGDKYVVIEDLNLRNDDNNSAINSKIVAYMVAINNGELKRKVLGSVSYKLQAFQLNDLNIDILIKEDTEKQHPAVTKELIKYLENYADYFFVNVINVYSKRPEALKSVYSELGYKQTDENKAIYYKKDSQNIHKFSNDYDALYKQAMSGDLSINIDEPTSLK